MEVERRSTPTESEIRTETGIGTETDATKYVSNKFGHTLKDEWPCGGPDVKGRAHPGPNIFRVLTAF